MQQVVRDKKTAACDFAPYAPCEGTYASFIAAPVVTGDKVEMVVACKCRWTTSTTSWAVAYSEVIKQVKDVSRAIASAVEEPSITTREIAQNVAETSKAAQTVSIGVSQSAVASSEISQTIAGVDEASRQTTQGASQTHSAGAQRLQLASELNDLVGRFKT